ncbi:MAG: excinuclease ABC subunit UvrC [Myxococcales bacterium]|nr:excinuclease ABC subunit UvrC [Myxococcales bacterium]
MDDRFREILDRTPTDPGVYMMKDKKGKLVYIGKARDLRARLRTYFNGGDPRPFARRLSRILGDVETVITRNEKEALLLENRLIKAHQPRYNIKLRDDKNFLSLRLDTRVDWPRVQVVRRQQRDGAQYFGPYHSASSVRQTLRILNKHFGLRTCPDRVLNNRSRPCLQYQIKRCPGPCVFDVDREAYNQSVREAVLFLQGKHQELKDTLSAKMESAAQNWEYELAGHYRDQIRDVERSLVRQEVETNRTIDQDVVGLYREGEQVVVELLYIRRGIINGTRRFSIDGKGIPNDELLCTFLMQYYGDGRVVPHEVLVPEPVEGEALVEEALSELRGTKVTVTQPQRGNRRALMEIAQRNAAQAFQESMDQAERRSQALGRLRDRLHLAVAPNRIECFDISNLQDTAIVGSMVVFQDGEPDKSSYRTFKVKSQPGQDDFAAMEEVLSRRIKRSREGTEPWPDLVVIDGGKGQLNRVLAAFANLGVHDVPVVSLAKSRLKSSGDNPEKVRTDERVFLPGAKDPIILRAHTDELHLMQQIRDEAHRFAITYHRKLRRKRAISSVLDRIPGIGEAKRQALLQHFGSISRIKAADADDLSAVPGISEALAHRIVAALGGRS